MQLILSPGWESPQFLFRHHKDRRLQLGSPTMLVSPNLQLNDCPLCDNLLYHWMILKLTGILFCQGCNLINNNKGWNGSYNQQVGHVENRLARDGGSYKWHLGNSLSYIAPVKAATLKSTMVCIFIDKFSLVYQVQ